jgi:hypothetical protein
MGAGIYGRVKIAEDWIETLPFIYHNLFSLFRSFVVTISFPPPTLILPEGDKTQNS